MQNIPAVANNKPFVNSAEFVKLTIYNDYENPGDNSVYTFSSAYKEETIDGILYTPMGGLLSVGVQPRELRVTGSDTSIAISGIDGNNIYVVLANKVKGSELEIIRGFYNSNYVMTSTARRFTGIITSYNITETREGTDDSFVVTLNASSYKTVLENRIAGRKTNQSSWQSFDSTDTSMNNVYSISGRSFDFGQPVTAKAVTVSNNDTSSSTNETQA